MRKPDQRLLLIDTCGETAGVALSLGDQIIAQHDLDPGRASAEIIAAIRQLLTQSGWPLASLTAIGVVSGPGSFTGTRTGLAAAKGLCEALGLPLIAVSRLAVLAAAAKATGTVAALDAGRGECYLRDPAGPCEFLCKIDDLAAALQGRPLVIAEPRLHDRLHAMEAAELRPLHAADALPLVREALRSGDYANAALAEANYVRQEADIYSRTAEPRTAEPRAAGK